MAGRAISIWSACVVGRPRKASVGLPVHVHVVRARGHLYYYYQHGRGARLKGPRVKLPGSPYDDRGHPIDAWWVAYRKLATSGDETPRAGTVSALILAYKASAEWRVMSERSKGERIRHLKRIEDVWGDLNVAGIEPWHIVELRDMHAKTPGEANNLIRGLSAMLGWSVPRGWRSDNPCGYVKKLKIGEGWLPWSWEDIEHFKAHARPVMWHAAALALYTGQRLGDVIALRWSDIDGGVIRVKQGKTKKRLAVALHRDLKALLAELPRSSETVLLNRRGGSWTADGFKASWQAQLNDQVMQRLRERRLVFHGLRKSAVVFLLEAGCTDAEVAAITGQSREMVEHYAREVNQRRLAASAVLKWEADGDGTRQRAM
jgi:hypothetical protein